MISIGISYPFLFIFSLILEPCKVVDIKISFLKTVLNAESKISVVNSKTTITLQVARYDLIHNLKCFVNKLSGTVKSYIFW